MHPLDTVHFYSVSYLVDLFENSSLSRDAFVGLAYDAISSVSLIPQPPKSSENIGSQTHLPTPDRMSPGRAVQTFRELFIIETFTSRSEYFEAILKDELTEEFKYFAVFLLLQYFNHVIILGILSLWKWLKKLLILNIQ